MRTIRRLLLSFLLGASVVGATSSPLAAAGQGQNRNAINGMITDSAHQPVQNIRIELLDDVNRMLTSTRTDSTGRFRFGGLSQGAFLIRVITSGTNYIEYVQRIEIFNVRGFGAHLEQVQIVLRTREETKNNNAPVNPGVTFAQSVPDEARKAYEKGAQLLDGDHNSEEGMERLKEAIKLFPDYYLALERLGAEYVRRNQFEPARETLTRAISINPRGVLSHFALGVAQYRTKQYPASIEALQRSISLAPNSPNAPQAYFYLGMAQMRDGKNTEAETSLKKAYELGGKQTSPDVHMALAQIYSNTKRYKEAADELEVFLKEAPDARDAENIRKLIKQLRDKAAKS
jgi:tetratricopeptide (TPR) repeat protein